MILAKPCARHRKCLFWFRFEDCIIAFRLLWLKMSYIFCLFVGRLTHTFILPWIFTSKWQCFQTHYNSPLFFCGKTHTHRGRRTLFCVVQDKYAEAIISSFSINCEGEFFVPHCQQYMKQIQSGDNYTFCAFGSPVVKELGDPDLNYHSAMEACWVT